MMTLNHGLSGYVVSQVAMPLLQRRAPAGSGLLSAAFFFGAMAPDADVITRALGGRGAYLADAWYSHRVASHSLAGTLVLAIVLAGVMSALQRRQGGNAGYGTASRRFLWVAGCAWAGGLLHIVGDLFTPGSPMPLLWPLAAPQSGAWRHIGWFSPYLLWLFLVTIALGLMGTALLPRRGTPGRAAPAMIWSLYALATYRWLHFLVVSRYESAAQWEAYQQALLPDALVTPVASAVSAGWVWLTR